MTTKEVVVSIGTIVLVGASLVVDSCEGVAVSSVTVGDDESACGAEVVQAARVSRINTRKHERIKRHLVLSS